ncbi:flagellar hook-basal body complex protein [Selenomonas ruminantium]|uniref:flagellar hook-basal body complex protein n=1 Tax=Selenomonas ruminantium TaxID=971 RepID=UPI00047B6B8A|nr:flagellar hook-basal body complex protein [Selenomonas ruminantium]
MMRSLFSGVSGLKGHQTRMDVIGNNIANVNTTGFKSGRVTFADTLSQTQSGAAAPTENLGGTNPKQIGLGVAVASIDTLFTDGSIQSTGKNTDLCLSGNGLFVVKNGNETYYTRDGAFEFDAAGNYVLPGSGMMVQGWMANNGVLSTNGAVTSIQVEAGKSMAATATTSAVYANNLDASEETIQEIKLKDSKGNTILIDSTNTDSWSCGGTYTSKITNLDVDFSNGLTISSAKGKYAVGTKYNLFGPTTVNLANGDVISVPIASTKPYKVGNGMPTSSNAIQTYVPSTKTATLSDTATLTNNSGQDYIVTLGNKDTIKVPTSSTATSYNLGTAITDTVSSITGKNLILASGGTLTNNSMSLYTSILSNGDKLTVSNSSATTYSANATFPTSVTVTAISTTSGSGTITLSDGSTIAANNVASYTLGNPVSANLTTIDSLPTALVSNISPNVSSSINSMSGKVQSGDSSVQDSWSTTSSAVSLVPAKGLTASSLSLGDDNGSIIKVTSSDTTPYQVGDQYTSTIDAISITMSDGTISTKTSGSYTLGYSMPLTTTLNVYDTLGNAHSIVVYFTKTKTDSINGNQWTVQVNLDGSGATKINEPDGSITTVAMSDTTLQFTTDGKYSDGAGTLNLTLTNGSTGSQSVTVDLSQLTQYAGNNTVNGTCDGNAAGTLKSVSVDSSGIITGVYTNGVSQAEAQIAVAQFTNASGLTKTGSSLYQESNNSGTPNVKTATDLGVTITPSALEMSNVDIANEFSDMIITQRGFQSNSKVITVGDEMLETLINMKR